MLRGVFYVTGNDYFPDTLKDEIEPCSFKLAIEHLKKMVYVGVDTETTGFFNFKNVIKLLQLGNSNVQFVFDFPTLTLSQRCELLMEVFSNPKKLKIFANAKFDIQFLWFHGFTINKIYDVILQEMVLNAGMSTVKGFYSLKEIGKRYLNVDLDKEARGLIHRGVLTPRIIKYAAEDVAHLENIMRYQLDSLKKIGAYRGNITDIHTICGLENEAVLAFGKIEYNGMKLDRSKMSDLRQVCIETLKEAEDKLVDYVWSDNRFKNYRTIYADLFTPPIKKVSVNWRSPAQKLSFLQKAFPYMQTTSEREMSRNKNKDPIFGLMLNHAKAEKLMTSFVDVLEGYINPQTGRIHPSFKQILNTGRVSCKSPNLQQIPSKGDRGQRMRSAFIPEPGKKIVGGDYSGCELRIIAEMSGDPVWVDAFLQKKDLHTELCKLTFGITEKEVTAKTPFNPNITYRDVQKTINFG